MVEPIPYLHSAISFKAQTMLSGILDSPQSSKTIRSMFFILSLNLMNEGPSLEFTMVIKSLKR